MSAKSVLHHLIADAWTFGLLANQLEAAYLNLSDQGARELYQADYIDFIHSEDKYFTSNHFHKDKLYWEEKYHLPPEKSPVKPGLSAAVSIRARRRTSILPLALELKLKEYGKAYSVTPAVLFETALIIYLSKINPEHQSITIGVPVLNRKNAREKIIAGMFISTMPLTVAVDTSMSVLDLARRISKGHMDLFRHQKYPYADILKFLREKKGFSGRLYDVMISYQNAKTHTSADTKWYSNGYSEIPLVIHIDNRDERESHTVHMDYQMEVFEQKEIEYLAERLGFILEQMIERGTQHISEIALIPHRERINLIEDFNQTTANYPKGKCAHELFTEQAKRTPDRTALVFEEQAFTYQELDEMSISLAHFLREKGIGRGDTVPIIAKRSWHIPMAMLGILKAGGAYMPVDPNYPLERIKTIIGDSKAKLVLRYCFFEDLDILSFDLSSIKLYSNIKSVININNDTDISYVIYTSGSTGKPKGICQTHRCLSNLISWQEKNLSASKHNILCSTIITFDVSIQEMLYCLINGGTLYISNEFLKLNPLEYINYIKRNKIDTIFITPSYFNLVITTDVIEQMASVQNYIFAGEKFKIDESILKKLESKKVLILNQYGPSETHVVTNKRIDTFSKITIGCPIANTQIYLLDTDKNPVPVGVPGELYIAGDGVGLGYLNRPDLTAERFMPNPFATGENHHGKIMYRTGDLAQWRADGEIEYLGRIDTQVKIRGLRIELGEIENAMSGFPGIRLAAVADGRDKNDRQYLTGYYTADESIDEKALRSHLSARLPKYMVPNYFVHLDAMPMTPSGKTDRRHLPEPDFTMPERTYTAPETETEKRLALIWEHLLELSQVGKEDDFFELGGDSLMAVSMLNEIEAEFHIEISIQDILEKTLLEQLAAYIDIAPVHRHIKASHKEKYLLLPQQKAIYAACLKEPDTLVYNMPAKLLLPDTVDRNKLRESITQVINHHKMLKSRIRTEGSQLYGIYDEDARIVFEEYQNGGEEAFVRPFSLEQAPLIRIGFTADALLFDLHHIIADGDSLNIILQDIAAAYESKPLSAPEIEYSDYSEYFYGLNTEEHRAYFKQMFQYDIEPTILPETGKAGIDGRSKLYQIPEALFASARKYARENGLTDTMVFLGAYGILLSGYTGTKDILTNIILQNRIHRETNDLVGMFVNTLPLRLTMQGELAEYMQEVKQCLLNLFRYQELPFEYISELL